MTLFELVQCLLARCLLAVVCDVATILLVMCVGTAVRHSSACLIPHQTTASLAG